MVDYSTIPASCQIPGLADIYRRWLPAVERGTFVEVGAYDGVGYSNTYCFCLAGWRGLQIEPDPGTFASLLENMKGFPLVTCERVACAEGEGSVKLYTAGELSTIVFDDNARAWNLSEEKFTVVPTVALDVLLENHDIPPRFEVLVIDVEGAELKVLAGFDLPFWRPRLAIVETHERHTSIRNDSAQPIIRHFEAHGYCKVYTDHINSVFVT